MTVSDDDVLRMKESKFEAFVELASKLYELKYKPRVVFMDGYIPDMPNAMACIDIYSSVIRVSRAYLINMSDEEIKNTAFHEVIHLFNASHDTAFYGKLSDAITGTWEPPGGVIVIDGNARSDDKKSKKLSKPKKNRTYCNYHQCGKKAELVECRYCGGHFCYDHIRAVPPSMRNFNYPNKFVDLKSLENRHPCAPYFDYLQKKEKEQLERYEEALNRMSGKGRFRYFYRREMVRIQPKKEPKKKPETKKEIEKVKIPREKRKEKKPFKERPNFCPYCGAKFGNDFKFCGECGAELM